MGEINLNKLPFFNRFLTRTSGILIFWNHNCCESDSSWSPQYRVNLPLWPEGDSAMLLTPKLSLMVGRLIPKQSLLAYPMFTRTMSLLLKNIRYFLKKYNIVLSKDFKIGKMNPQMQRYEAGSVIYGPHTLSAHIDQYKKLARSIFKVSKLQKFF